MKDIRLATAKDLPRMLDIYEHARAFMRENGNPSQWAANYPGQAALEKDMDECCLYVLEDESGIYACFKLIDYPDPTYSVIYEGTWKDESPYMTLHRVASDGSKHGIFAKAVAFAKERGAKHLRVDTHNDNIPMQKAILREGFEFCGIIFVEDGTPRRAYEWIAE